MRSNHKLVVAALALPGGHAIPVLLGSGQGMPRRGRLGPLGLMEPGIIASPQTLRQPGLLGGRGQFPITQLVKTSVLKPVLLTEIQRPTAVVE
jgi:hypothetical protein